MKLVFKEDNILIENEKGNKYIIKKEHINGTLYENYFVYEICDNQEYYVREYTTLEEALKDLGKGYIEV